VERQPMSWLEIGRVLKEHSEAINSLDFTKDGELLLSSGDDGRVCLYSTTQGVPQHRAICAAKGATMARFTHDPLSVVAASSADHTVRYLSLHDNRYLRSFRAHTDSIVSIEMSPKEDLFTTASMDDTARIWDLRQTNCQGVMRFQGGGCRPTVAFDPHGLVFAAAIGGKQVRPGGVCDALACHPGDSVCCWRVAGETVRPSVVRQGPLLHFHA
jgi:COMPASS component SWD2